MDSMRGAFERAKMLVGMEVDEESGLPPPEEQSFFDDFNRNCTLTTTQASVHPLPVLAPRIRGSDPQPYPDLAADLVTSRGLARNRGTGRGRNRSSNAVALSNHVLTSFASRGCTVSRYAWLPA
jgi:hypothetical protein